MTILDLLDIRDNKCGREFVTRFALCV